MNKTIGLLLPRSVIYPSIAFDILAGLRESLNDAGLTDAEIKTESIGLGADDKMIYSACEALLFQGVSVITGYVNPTSAEKLAPLFTSAGALFISLDAGYHFPTSTKKLSPVFYLSLQGALCVRTITAIALEEGKKNMAYAGSFYDSGYRGPYAFHKSIEEGGGTVTFNLITPLKRADITLKPLENNLKTTEVDAVFASFCGDMLQDFCAAAATDNVFKDHSLYGSSFTGEEQWLAQSLYPGRDIKVCVPWASDFKNDSNIHFTELLKNKNKNVNIFSLLGWEAGMVISKIVAVSDIATAINNLEGFEFNSPRGKVKLDAATHQCYAPVYEAWIKKDDTTGNCKLLSSIESAVTEEQRIKLEEDINSIAGPTTSWFNAYACLDS
jgi:branched-chain amino acid transport system substrate-binding protein